MRPILLGILLCAGLGTTPSSATSRPARLSFADRVAAQAAIERVYHAHQVGARRSFEAAAPPALLARKVRTYLAQSAALERVWGVRVTAEMLMDEARRMAGGTRLPARLRELHEALGNDPLLILECLVRPALVERLTRERFAATRAGGADAAKDRDAWWAAVEPGLEGSSVEPVEAPAGLPLIAPALAGAFDPATAGDSILPRTSATGGCLFPFQYWDGRQMTRGIYGLRQGHLAVWTGSLLLIWGGGSTEGERFDPATGTVTPMSYAPASVPRKGNAVWTGREMVIWDGLPNYNGGGGGRYDPVSDTWRTLSLLGAPATGAGASAVWTGTQMIVWGGETAVGGAYDPDIDFWTPVAAPGAPSARSGHIAVWTGARMLVWGGETGPYAPTSTGASYDPVARVWSPISTTGAPSARALAAGVWTGLELLVWGGRTDRFIALGTGGRYRPDTNTWTELRFDGAPAARYGHHAFWTGGEMLIWGGTDAFGTSQQGGLFDPAADQWRPIAASGAAGYRTGHTATWIGQQMIVWGGTSWNGAGGMNPRYDLAGDRWLPATVGSGTSAPDYGHTVVWTGSEMIVWGGPYPSSTASRSDGARYDPALDLWRGVSRTGLTYESMPGRELHTAVWTGDEMIVWGGRNTQEGPMASGARYDPLADAWTLVTAQGAPAPRAAHTATWTGAEMVIWGGEGMGGSPFANGGRYDPVSDTWTPVQTQQAPGARSFHKAVWTGERILIWGGSGAGGGGRYDPAADRWDPINPHGAPVWREDDTVVWSGAEMILWGGSRVVVCSPSSFCTTFPAEGGRYDPHTDTWRSVATAGAPTPRTGHSAVWTGQRMLVWGGRTTAGGPGTSTGGAYDPAVDQWAPLPTTGAPAARFGHTAIWTGEGMLVWGRSIYSGAFLPGGHLRQDLSADGDGDCVGIDFDCDDADPVVFPGAPQVCGDARNNDCRHAAWPLLPGTNEIDDDGDGLNECAGDCDDARAAVFPGAPQICDGRNNDCLAPGWPSIAGSNETDDDADTWSECAGDCDDARRTVYPDAPESCDGALSNCRAPGWPSVPVRELDLDQDGYAECNGECDDARAAVYPFAPQVCGDGLNNDCRHPRWPDYAGINETDDDGDTVSECAGDCNDLNSAVYPGAPEICDTVNNDCLSPAWPTPPADNLDRDFDGFALCEDCDDFRASVRPGGPQICGDALNNDCDDPRWPDPAGQELDADGDGIAPCSGDCDDANPGVYPRAPQLCDGLNNDCYAGGWPATIGTNEADNDGDGLSVCQSDCNDTDPSVWVGSPGEATDLRVAPGGILFNWSPPAPMAGLGALGFDLLRAPDAPTLFVDFGQCVESGGADLEATDAEEPFLGGIFYYLVRSRGACGAGPAGFNSAGDPIPARACP